MGSRSESFPVEDLFHDDRVSGRDGAAQQPPETRSFVNIEIIWRAIRYEPVFLTIIRCRDVLKRRIIRSYHGAFILAVRFKGCIFGSRRVSWKINFCLLPTDLLFFRKVDFLNHLLHGRAMLDSSPAMLELAARAAREAGVTDKVALQHGDATRLADLFPARSFDVILCHNILEYCDDPGAVLRAAARALRDSSAILSVLVRNQAGEVFKAAIQAGDLTAANNSLTAEWGQESLFGGRVRLFTPDGLRAMLAEASLAAIAERGVRVLADYLPPRVSRSADYERIFELERKLGTRPEYAAVARYSHCLARRLKSAAEDGA